MALVLSNTGCYLLLKNKKKVSRLNGKIREEKEREIQFIAPKMPFILPYMCDSYYEMLHVSCYGDIVDQDKSHTWSTALNYDQQKKEKFFRNIN